VQQTQIPLEMADETLLFIDLRVKRGQAEAEILIVEVKCFSRPQAELDDFYQALGQYIVYRQALAELKITESLYLAITDHIYGGLLQRKIIAASLKQVAAKVIVVDLNQEVITLWIRY
jgi:hypothetical protein